MVVPNEINYYLETLISERDPLLQEMEQYAKTHNVPIMELVGIECMLQLLRIVQPKRILEIGTAIGYSAIRMANAVPNAEIITIERDKERYEKALEYITKANLLERITVIYGDALECIEKINEMKAFEVLFIDAAKGQYERFFELYGPLVKSQGAIISDNVLFRGLVAQETSSIEKKRLQSMVTKLKHYNQWLIGHPDYRTTIFPVGDGMALSIKK
ncbi:O-methyltransferase [Anaerobacillus sp. MEB173]|uniref:O-methyltransferase n=1 Tax=Anaerobacillus sp. MEB173 TaxID=3383345 RepID=UPI003F905FF8